MKQLRLINVFTAATVCLGMAFAVVFAVCLPEARTLSGIAFAFGLGALLAFVMAGVFGPMAAVPILGRHLLPFAARIHWYASLLLWLSLGYVGVYAITLAFGVGIEPAGAWLLVGMLVTVVLTANRCLFPSPSRAHWYASVFLCLLLGCLGVWALQHQLLAVPAAACLIAIFAAEIEIALHRTGRRSGQELAVVACNPMTINKFAWWNYLLIPLLVVAAGYSIAVLSASAPGDGHGLRVLDTDGCGYRRGNVVWLDTANEGLSCGDVVLYDWERALGLQGFGPRYTLAKVIACPRQEIQFRQQTGVCVVDGGTILATPSVGQFERHDLPHAGSYVLQPGIYFLSGDDTTKTFFPVSQEHVLGRICFKIGENPLEERRLKHVVY